MKIHQILYVLSFVILFGILIILINFPNSNRAALIAGTFTFIDFGLNIAGYTLKNKTN
jgi:hypothetical protein